MTVRSRGLMWPAIIALCGVALSVAACRLVRSTEQHAAFARLEYASMETFDDITDVLQGNVEATQAVAEHLNVTGDVTRREFHALVAPALARHPTLLHINWAPRVAGRDRGAVEAAARRDGLADFRIVEQGPRGGLTAAAERREYFPLLYVESLRAVDLPLGFDLASEPVRRAALAAAAATGETIATPRLSLARDGGRRSAVLTVTAVFRRGAHPANDDQRNDALVGYVVGAYRVGDVVDSVMAAPGRARLDIRIFDLSAATGRRRLYPDGGGEHLADLRGRPHVEREIHVGGRSWLLVSTSGQGNGFASRQISWLVLAVGLGLTALAAALVHVASSRDRARRSVALAVRQERDFTRSVIDSLPGMFYVIGADGRIELWNRMVESITGYVGDEIASRSPQAFFDGEDQASIVTAVAEVFAQGTSEVDATLVTKAGQRIPFHFSSQRMDWGDGVKLVGMGIDISARKRAEEAMRQKTEELARSNAELEQFAYVASHDLREPLRMVSAYVGLLDRRYGAALDGEGREFIAFAREGAERMDHLILDLLEYSRLGRKARPVDRVALADAVGEAMRILGPQIAECGARVEVAGELPTLTGDYGDMVRLFQNLIGNALKYRAADRVPAVTVSARRQGDEWEIAVADNGIGIAPEFFDRIFLIFQRLHTRQHYEGTGIGLAICRRIVEHHGGRIRVESTPGQGATFLVALPATEG